MKIETKKKLASWIGQLLIFIALFVLITSWQQKDMLSTQGKPLAPNFTLPSVDGTVEEFDASDQTKKTLVYFFAPWCSVCHLSIDNIEAIRQSTSEDIQFYAIALDWKTRQEVEDFLSEHELGLPVLFGTQKIQDEYKILGFPSYYVIDADGRLHSKDMGYTTELGMRIRLGLASSNEA